MAPVQNAVLVVPAENSAAVPSAELCEKSPERIVDDLLSDLQDEARRKQYADIYRKTHDQLQAFLRPFFKSEQDAQEVLTDVYIAMLRGECGEEHLFRFAKQRAINRQEHLAVEAQILEPLDCGHAGRHTDPEETGASDAEMLLSEFRSPHAGNQDPLDTLLRREELAEGIRTVMTDRKYRGVRSRKWWKDLVAAANPQGAVPEMAG